MSTSDRNEMQLPRSAAPGLFGTRLQEPAEAILRRRAEALARPLAPSQPRNEIEVLAFTAGPERYAVETRYVLDVASVAQCAAVPGAPPFLAGVIPRRGEILPAINLGALLGGSVRISDVKHAIVHGTVRAEFGILASGVEEVASLATTELLVDDDGRASRYVRGVTRDGRVVLDGAALLGSRALYVDAIADSGISPATKGPECSAR